MDHCYANSQRIDNDATHLPVDVVSILTSMAATVGDGVDHTADIDDAVLVMVDDESSRSSNLEDVGELVPITDGEY